MKYDLILSHYTNAKATAEAIKKHVPEKLTDGHLKLMLKETPLRILRNQGEFHVKRLAEALITVGCTVKILPVE
jgi:hypothetical protein